MFERAFISGGSSGIGLATARLLLSAGTRVLLIARNSEKLERARRDLIAHGASPDMVETLSLDVSVYDQVQHKLSPWILAGKVPDLLINCAGMADPDYFEHIDGRRFSRTLEVNLSGTWNMVRIVAPGMRRGAQIVNVSSVAGFIGLFGYSAYSASKFGVVGLSEALRNELSVRGIGVSVLYPPDTDTPQLEQESRTKPYETKVIAGNAGLMKAEDVARALLRGAQKRKFAIIPGLQSKLIYLVKRFFPGLVYRIMDRDAKKAYYRRIQGE
ncbi:MAG TPA: SDR family NAD(P)-dependent oxidoreductase [Sediminispirochaeta sp.]|nr:SDR family NAD(P)-dependent oxidoreductase [Sediminispirochaeta sp.]